MQYVPTIKVKINNNDDKVNEIKVIFSPRVVEYHHNNNTFAPKITKSSNSKVKNKPTFKTVDQTSKRIDNHIIKEVNEIKKELDNVDIDGIKNNSDYELIINKLYETFDREIEKVLFYNVDSFSKGAKLVKVNKELFDKIPNKSDKLSQLIDKVFNLTLYQSGWDGIEPIILSFSQPKGSNGDNEILWNKGIFFSNNVRTLHIGLSFITGYHYRAVSINVPNEDINNVVHYLHNYIKNY